jgi:hypothetical protein
MVTVVLLNNTLRTSDSAMLEVVRRMHRDSRVMLALLCVGGVHKQNCDIGLAQTLKYASRIHWIRSADLSGLARRLNKFPRDSGGCVVF